MTTNSGIVLTDIEAALKEMETVLPGILALAGTFYPPLAVVAKFLPLLETAISAVEVVMQATGGDAAAAVATVESHLTPGQPNAPALAPAHG